MSSENLRTLTLAINSGKFLVGEKATTGKSTTTVKEVSEDGKTIVVENPVKGLLDLGTPLIGLKSQAIGIILNNIAFEELIDSAIDSVTDAVTGAVNSVTSQINSKIDEATGALEKLKGSLVSDITSDKFFSGTADDLKLSLGETAAAGFLQNLTEELIRESLFLLTVKIIDGPGFQVDEVIRQSSRGIMNSYSFCKAVNQQAGTITVTSPGNVTDYAINDRLLGNTSRTLAEILEVKEIDTFDIFNLFGGLIPENFSFTDLISGIEIDPSFEFISTDKLIPDLVATTSIFDRDVVSDPSVVVDESIEAIRDNPINPGLIGLASPNDRNRTNLANEPTDKFEGEYPYNKSYKSESGHLLEIDDTPGKERLLNEHVSGTYTEMKPDGNFVTKIVGDNYTIVAGDGIISIEGKAVVHVTGDCNLRVGGFLTISSDSGINVITKGDFRLKANSINMESTSGSISAKSAKDVLFTAKENTQIKAKKNLIGSAEITSITTGQQFVVDSKKISQRAETDITFESGEKTSINSTGDLTLESNNSIFMESAKKFNIKSGEETSIGSGKTVNIKSAEDTKVTAPALEVDAVLNVKNTTNLRATGNDSRGDSHDLPINGQGADAAADAEAATPNKPEDPVLPEDSKGSGITFVENPSGDLFMAIDDEPEKTAVFAIKDALDKGTLKKEDLDYDPPQKESYSGPATGERKIELEQSTIKNIGTTIPDNLRLSTNFVVSQLTKTSYSVRNSITAQRGISAEQIVQNLQLLCQNVLEPIKKKYPNMGVSSGFRSQALNNAISGSSSTSQHMLGQAADIVFSGVKLKDYAQIASWIKDNVPYDRLILEYAGTKDRGVTTAWIHISFKGFQNRNTFDTFFNHKIVPPGGKLINLADR